MNLCTPPSLIKVAVLDNVVISSWANLGINNDFLYIFKWKCRISIWNSASALIHGNTFGIIEFFKRPLVYKPVEDSHFGATLQSFNMIFIFWIFCLVPVFSHVNYSRDTPLNGRQLRVLPMDVLLIQLYLLQHLIALNLFYSWCTTWRQQETKLDTS